MGPLVVCLNILLVICNLCGCACSFGNTNFNELKEQNIHHAPAIEAFYNMFVNDDTVDLHLIRAGMSTVNLYSFKLSGKSYVLRMLPFEVPHIKRVSEINMHKLCATKGIAPKIIFVDTEDDPSLIVMEYVEDSRIFSYADFKNVKIIRNIIAALKIIHNSCEDIILCKQSLIEEMQNEAETLSKSGAVLPSEFGSWRNIMADISAMIPKNKPVKVHGDLAPGNILITKDENVYFIDFQESRFDDRLSDIGYFLYESGTTKLEQITELLSLYFERQPTESEIKSVLLYKMATAFASGVYRYHLLNNIDKTVDLLDNELLKITYPGSRYMLNGDYSKYEICQLSSESKLQYVLSFFKEFFKMKSCKEL